MFTFNSFAAIDFVNSTLVDVFSGMVIYDAVILVIFGVFDARVGFVISPDSLFSMDPKIIIFHSSFQEE